MGEVGAVAIAIAVAAVARAAVRAGMAEVVWPAAQAPGMSHAAVMSRRRRMVDRDGGGGGSLGCALCWRVCSTVFVGDRQYLGFKD